MSDYEDYSQWSDEQLISSIIASPNFADGIGAKEILEYRKYLVAKNQNLVIVVLTIVMAISAVIDVVFRIVESSCLK